MSLSFTSAHKFHNEDFILDYFIRDWRVYPEKPGGWKLDHTREQLAHALGFEGWDPLTEMDTGYFPDEVVYELLEKSGMVHSVEDNRELLDLAHQLIDGPLWVSVNSDGEDQNIPEEVIKYLEFCDDYDETLDHERVKNSEVNLHRYLAVQHDHSNRGKVVRECGRLFEGENRCGEVVDTWVGNLYCKDRFKVKVTIYNVFPEGERGYALGISDYGKVYITEKFRGHIPEVGSSMEATVALTDVGFHNGREKMCRLNLIYIH